MNNLITLAWCDEDRARVDRLIALLEAGAITARPEAPTETSAPADHPVAEALPWSEAPVDPVPEVSLADFQKALTLRCAESAEMRDKVRALLNQYAEAASKVPPEKRAEVLAKLAEL